MSSSPSKRPKRSAEDQYAERYAKLNVAQKRAVDSIEGPLLVVAGPGSGKTEILSLRVANIRRQTQVLPGNILCLTFTEYAALNMRDRLAKLIGGDAYHVSIHTFHNFCVDVIQRYPEFFYDSASFSPADDLAKTAILEDIFSGLSYDDPLRSVHPEQGFVFLKPAGDAIRDLKSAGISPDEFKEIIEHNAGTAPMISEILSPVMEKTASKKTLPDVEKALRELEKRAKDPADKRTFPPVFFRSLMETTIASLRAALDESLASDTATPLSKWKETWMKKTDEGGRALKDQMHIEKMRALGRVYRAYRKEMHRQGLYDFDDMILDVIEGLQKYPRLLFEIQEQFQYLLVDEFQDTNDAQMRLLRLIAEAPVNEGRPNIMVVGDDDQAIYKFQGAELSNILDFKRLYNDVEVVTMTDNYRSTQDILDLSSNIIRRGTNRLENLIPELDKTLVAKGGLGKAPDADASPSRDPLSAKASVIYKRFPTSLHQYHFVSREIRRLLDQGHEPEEIAVISRKHRQLAEMVPYLQGVAVPLRYEREQNVFEEPHIRELIVLARFVASLDQKLTDEADDLLPQILSFPFWNIDRRDVWRISLEAAKGGIQRKWMEVMLEYKDPRVRAVADFLLEVAARASSDPLEKILDMLIGAHTVLLAESEDDDEDASAAFGADKAANEKGNGKSGARSAPLPFSSPFKEFYFNKERFEHSRAEYLAFLSSLRVFVQALREYKNGKMLLIKDLVEFVDIHEKNELPLNDKSPFASVRKAVNLLTAHKAKGLEFKTVFVLSCQDDIWAGRGRVKKLSLPSNLPVEKAGDDEDDHLRLFYVALTRAKTRLYLISYDLDDDGSVSAPLRFLPEPAGDAASAASSGSDPTDAMPEAHEVLTASWLTYHTPPFFGEEKKLLASILEEYKLSVTHLNNFLNVVDGGPQKFFEENILRFPHAKTLSGAYGSAIHKALEEFSLAIRGADQSNDGNASISKDKDSKGKDQKVKIPTERDLLDSFERALQKERLGRIDHANVLSRGRDALKNFYEAKRGGFSAADRTEVNFSREGALAGAAHLSGKIDRMVDLRDTKGPGFLEVHDYKTGKASESWDGRDVREKIKLRGYKRQLLFYKLLVERSKTYGGSYKVARGVLEFVEPVKHGKQIGKKGPKGPAELAELSTDYEDEDMHRFARLVEAVYKKIMDLDLPDISKYSKDLKGIIQFEEDLLA